MAMSRAKEATDVQLRAIIQWLDPSWAGKWPLMLAPYPLLAEDRDRIQARLTDLSTTKQERDPQEVVESHKGGLMYPQIEAIREALAHIPDSNQIERDAAIQALKTLYATIEVQGARIIQLNNMIPLDERGDPATQEYVDALLRRPRVPSRDEVSWILTTWEVPQAEHDWLAQGPRARYVLEIWEGLRSLMPENHMAEAWMSRANDNPLFKGEPPVKLLLRADGLPAIHALVMGRLNGW